VIDGVSIGYGAPRARVDGLSAEIQAEREVLGTMRTRCESDAIVADTIGAPMCDSIAWSAGVDLYISHFGSMQHKAAWVSNVHGIVHGNALCTQSGGNHPTYYAREDGITPIFVASLPGTDAAAKKVSGDKRNNLDSYELDWKVLADHTLGLLNTLPVRLQESQSSGRNQLGRGVSAGAGLL
jgi:hypothetical protein